ncbi:MAG TPA: sulfatase-like hydrolase/transferase [Planctomycetota bacterium]
MLLLAALLLAQGTSGLTPGQAAPSVVIFVLDDVAAADLALYGGPVSTPALEGLAGEGVRFTNAYANPSCAPTRRSIQYGHWWTRGNGALCEDAVDSETPTYFERSLAEALPGHAALFVGKWHLGSSPSGTDWRCAPIERGYDLWRAGLAGNVQGCGGFGYLGWQRVDADASGCSSIQSDEYPPREMRDAFLATWPRLRRPALAVVNCNLAHSPFHRPPPDMLPRGYPPTPTARSLYEAMIAAWDRSLGRMLSVIDLERTLVVVMGDNGTPGQVAPEDLRAKGTTFERGVRVPLVVAGPPVAVKGSTSDALVHAVDLWATAVVFGGGSAAGESRSLLPLLAGKRVLPHEYVLCGNGWGTPEGDRCVVSAAGLKLRQLDLDGDERVDHEELYDLRADPDELVDLLQDPLLAPALAAMRAWAGRVAP